MKTGRFASRDEVVKAGLARLMLDPQPGSLEPGEVEQIRTSLQQMTWSEFVDWKTHSANVRKRFGL